ncbi:hypothetical protein J6590_002076 [Homalodisca vitripennis]|nr:hypothetical protein J6590_002076 [Homalodisca vitripennis]
MASNSLPGERPHTSASGADHNPQGSPPEAQESENPSLDDLGIKGTDCQSYDPLTYRAIPLRTGERVPIPSS